VPTRTVTLGLSPPPTRLQGQAVLDPRDHRLSERIPLVAWYEMHGSVDSFVAADIKAKPPTSAAPCPGDTQGIVSAPT
jgi:hypothetical protein